MGNGKLTRRAHILMIPFEEQGHYTVFLQLLYFLSSFDIAVTVCISDRRVQHLRQLLSAGDLRSLDLRLETLSDDISKTASKTGAIPPLWEVSKILKVQFQAYMEKLATETDPNNKPTCLVADLLLDWSGELAEKLQIPRYLMFTTAGWFPYAAMKARIDATAQRGPEDIVRIPGLFSAPAKEIPSIIFPLVDLQNLAGILINSCEEIEGEECLEAVRSQLQQMTSKPGLKLPRYLPVGPMVHISGYSTSPLNKFGAGQTSAGRKSEALEWLDGRTESSVLYVAFGTMASIPASLILELARGLDLSGVPFLWVLRSSASNEPTTLLPSGFLDRVKARGFVETGWAPQLQVLQHPSTGGFVSHCGWNSSMEAIASGVPVLTWHLHGDQPLNARLITEGLKVGLPMRKLGSAEPVVPGEEVAAAVQSLMIGEKGKQVRKNSLRFQELVLRSMQEGGSSLRNLRLFTDDLVSS